jgi:hypothetical protein
MVVTTSAPYRLRPRYWRLSSCSARSASARSNGCAGEIDAGDDGALLHHHDRHLTFDLDAHVLEQTGGKQRAQRRHTLVVGVGITDTERQGREDGAGFGALQALDADVLQRERVNRPGRGRGAQQTGQRQRWNAPGA